MYDEYNALVKNDTWVLLPRPTIVNLVRSMWLFKHKFHANKTLSRYKAHLVANGSNQQFSIDFDETFSPVIKPATIRTVFSLAVSRKWLVHQLDVKNAFVNDDLLEPIYMYQPSGLFLSQWKYAIQLLEHAHMPNCNPSRTLADIESKMGPEGVPVQDPTLYRSLAAQHTLSSSSVEVEYKGVANFVVDTAWLHNLLRELHSPLSSATFVYYDNVSAIYLSVNPVQQQRTKHIEIDMHFVCDIVTADQVRVLHVPSRLSLSVRRHLHKRTAFGLV
uniref:Ribonuclease H-like domain-containing protein n=1 Tax=Tanacetum cinerariifolium TaxID=118510 RepID=A0A699HZQ6_TANCI|nr:ribonuclease H-like domain-containing protein [Tanacetum cinerariifolium]